jgi:hypothetical protein
VRALCHAVDGGDAAVHARKYLAVPGTPAARTHQRAVHQRSERNRGVRSATSAVRTTAQTAIAYFWNANVISALNQALQNIATQHHLDLIDTARLLAMGNMVSTDAGMACFDSKYTYLFWRPITAIHNADIDGNPATTADPTWTPLVTTPNHPEYPSQHGCVTSAFAQGLANALGTSHINATIPGAEGGATTLTTSQTFTTVRDLDTQLVDARVWIGFHYRNSVIVGENLGTAVADRSRRPSRPRAGPSEQRLASSRAGPPSRLGRARAASSGQQRSITVRNGQPNPQLDRRIGRDGAAGP